MQKKIYKVAILGVGQRGALYGENIKSLPDLFQIVSLCDKNEERLKAYAEKFGVKKENLFLAEEEFFKEKRADVLVIATQDKDHVNHTLKAFQTGYDVLVEKPLTDSREECQKLLVSQKKYGCKAFVCHVLRYAPAFLKVATLIDEGAIGRLVAIDALERVAYWHQAHSYVRGNWKKSGESTPMILAKCCHDLDLLQFYAKSKCESVSSIGDLKYFKKESAPVGATKKCVDCPYIEDCPYSAEQIYLKGWKRAGNPEDSWPYNVLARAPLNEEKLKKAIQTENYGKCVFYCDNDVVDHQLVDITFENGVKAHLTMTAFTHGSGRRMTFYGTLGEIVLDEELHEIVVGRFSSVEKEIIRIENLITEDKGYGHGGGDMRLVKSLYDVLQGKEMGATALEASIESHLMGICAEESRLLGGKLVKVHE